MVDFDASIDYDASHIEYADVPVGFARYQVLVDWNNDGDFADTNEDITDDVLQLTSRMGRNFASQLTGDAVAGSLEVNLNNNGGKYSPFNASGALYGNLLPNRKIQFASYYPSAVTLWSGFIESIQPEVEEGPHTIATLIAHGAFKKFATMTARVPQQTSEKTGDTIGEILDAVSWAGADRDLDDGQTTMTRFFASGNSLTAMREVEATEAGFLHETKDGKVAFEDRHHRLDTSTSTTSQATFADDGTGFGYIGISHADAMSLLYNEFTAPVTLYTTGSVAVLWTHPLAKTTGSAPALQPGESVEFIASYPNETTATDGAVSVDAWTTPASSTDYTTNAASNGTGTDYTSSLTVSVSKASKTMIITVTNGNANVAYLTKFQSRGTPITAQTVTMRAKDTTSQTTYGVRSFPRESEAKWTPTQEEANNWCLFNLAAHKDPTATVTLTYSANQSTTALAEAMERDLSDRVTVKASSRAKLGLSRDFFVESIIHRIIAGGGHMVTLGLSDSGGFTGFWVLGTSALGQATRFTY